MKRLAQLLAIASVTAVLAGCQTLNQSGEYKFEQAGQRTGNTVPVRLVRADESPVAGAVLYSVGWRYLGPKATPSQQLTPLQADARGNFVYRGGHLGSGDTLRLAARIKPDNPLIYGSVEVQ